MSTWNEIKYLAKRYLRRQIDFIYWKTYTILLLSRLEEGENAKDVARHFSTQEEDDSNV